jgi:hypothetical protein
VIGVAAGGALALPSSRLVFAGLAISPVILALPGSGAVHLGAPPGRRRRPAFVHAEDVTAGLPVWLIAMGGAAILMLASYFTRSIVRGPRLAVRALAARPGVPRHARLRGGAAGRLVAVRHPLADRQHRRLRGAPSNRLAVALPRVRGRGPPARATRGCRGPRAWCVVWIAGSTGACSGCVQAVGSHQEAKGVLGTLRLYTSGETAAASWCSWPWPGWYGGPRSGRRS